MVDGEDDEGDLMSWEDAIEETRAVSEENARRAAAEERFDNLNPFFENQIYPLMIEVTDRKKLWDFVAANIYAGKEDIPGAKIVAVQLRDASQDLEEALNWMKNFLGKHGRLSHFG